MEYDNNLPIYLQIINIIKKDLIKGNLSLGEKLPSTRDMAKKLKVNPNTIARAYKELETEKITFTKRGMGTYITEEKDILNNIKKEMAEDIFDNFIKGMTDLGFSKEEILTMIKEL